MTKKYFLDFMINQAGPYNGRFLIIEAESLNEAKYKVSPYSMDLNFNKRNPEFNFHLSGIGYPPTRLTPHLLKSVVKESKVTNTKIELIPSSLNLESLLNVPKLVLISGPSGVGKGPLLKNLIKTYPDLFYSLKVERLESTERDIEKINLKYLEYEEGDIDFLCRGKKQRIKKKELDNLLFKSNDKRPVIIEAYYKVFDRLKELYEDSTDYTTIFISPIKREDTKSLLEEKFQKQFLLQVNHSLLIRSLLIDKIPNSSKLIEELNKRALDSLDEIEFSKNYDNFLFNPYPESDIKWTFDPLDYEYKSIVDQIYKLSIF